MAREQSSAKAGSKRQSPAPDPAVTDLSAAGAFRSKTFTELMDRDPAVARAVSFLIRGGLLSGSRSKKVSIRVDPGVMDAAKKRFGLANESDVINASLAMAAAPDRFKSWLRDNQNTVTDDFELAV